MEEGLRAESLRALPWIALALPVNMVASVFTGALQGREAFASVTLASTLGQLMSQCFPLVVAWRWSRSLELLIPAALLARLATALLVAAVARSLVPLVGKPVFDRKLGRGLLGYGGWVTVSSIVGPVMSSMDRMVIAGISGSEAVTYYGVPQGLAARLLMLPSALSGALFPRFAASAAEHRDALADVSVRALAAVMTPAVLVGLFLAGPFLRIWISPDFANKATATAQIVFLGVWMNGLALVAFSSLQARGRPDLVARLHLSELPVYLGLLAVALHLWGVVGAAIAWTVRVSGDAVLLFAMGGYLRSTGRRLAVPIAILAIALLVLRVFDGVPYVVWPAGAVLLLAAGAWSLSAFPWHLIRRRPGGVSAGR
jgi:O-antigen/teichoic acid export membrane protein